MGLLTRFQNWILAIAGVVASALSIYAYGRHRGSQDTKIDMERADHDKAQKIEDAADRVRRADGDNLPPVERLSKYRKLRDLD